MTARTVGNINFSVGDAWTCADCGGFALDFRSHACTTCGCTEFHSAEDRARAAQEAKLARLQELADGGDMRAAVLLQQIDAHLDES